MAWIESHQTLRSHPKTRKAARALGIPAVHLMGHLHCLWHWALDLAEDGDLSKFDAEDIAIAADWDGDADKFVQALLDCGFGDGPGFLERDGSCGDPEDVRTGSLVLHDWWTYAGKLVARRQRDRRRKADARADGPPEDTATDTARPSEGSPQDVRGTSEGGSCPPAHARHDPTRPDTTKGESSRKRADRAHRLPDGWQPAPEPELVRAIGGPKAADRELAKFGDYWRAAPGAKGRKVDWQATWRNWLRRAAENTSTRSSGADPPARPIREYDPDATEDRFRALTGDAQ